MHLPAGLNYQDAYNPNSRVTNECTNLLIQDVGTGSRTPAALRTSQPPDYPIFWLIAIWQCEFHLYIKPFAGPGRAVIGRARRVARRWRELERPSTCREGARQGRQTLLLSTPARDAYHTPQPVPLRSDCYVTPTHDLRARLYQTISLWALNLLIKHFTCFKFKTITFTSLFHKHNWM